MSSGSQLVDALISENAELLGEIMMESQSRKNKNLISNRVAILMHRLERNLIRLGKMVGPEQLGEAHHMNK